MEKLNKFWDNLTHKKCSKKRHISLLDVAEELLKDVAAFWLKYQHVDFLYLPFKYPFNGLIFAVPLYKLTCVWNCAESSYIQPRKEKTGQNAQLYKKEIFESKIQNALSELISKDKLGANKCISSFRKKWTGQKD